MSSINFLGAASGLPLDELVSTFVNAERDTKLARINKTKTTLDASLSGVGQLKSALASFLDASKKLSTDNLKARAVSIVQPEAGKEFISATAKNTAAASSFDIKVNQLASGSRVESADGAYSDSSAVVSTTAGNLTFQADGNSFTVAVTAGMTMNELRLKINDVSDNFGVNANILNVGGAVGTKLVLTSTITGTGNDLAISNDNAELDAFSTVPTGASAGLAVTLAAKDAVIELDGTTVSSKTNVFDDVVQDISITVLAKTPDGNNAKLDVATDKTAAEKNINDFIKSYNTLVSQVATLTRKRILDADGKVTLESGALSGDSLPRNIMNQLRGVLGSTVSGAADSLNSLYSMGISMTKDGTLEISASSEFNNETGQARFDKALNQNFDNVAKLFGGDDGLISKLDAFVSEYTKTGGILSNRQDTIQSQLRDNTKASEAASRYIASYEDSLRKRYAALDTLLGQMQRQQASVTAALSSLPKFTSSSSS
ncbi:flagellar filament capping protein FliD [Rheinheimera sp. UJ63]|uniref:flagellar filament capping protein FliD n=1 Tax=Rheinheimera sp. UJ63 TaxID=2910157 RepID=UPI001F3D8ACD|nr:flagellar filament capping protein FliD [Rheinheimera sp. UJ63]MCF4009078.1 flagellar filament capping protein FliD [Rheinheimera sp. UJ63]